MGRIGRLSGSLGTLSDCPRRRSLRRLKLPCLRVLLARALGLWWAETDRRTWARFCSRLFSDASFDLSSEVGAVFGLIPVLAPGLAASSGGSRRRRRKAELPSSLAAELQSMEGLRTEKEGRQLCVRRSAERTVSSRRSDERASLRIGASACRGAPVVIHYWRRRIRAQVLAVPGRPPPGLRRPHCAAAVQLPNAPSVSGGRLVLQPDWCLLIHTPALPPVVAAEPARTAAASNLLLAALLRGQLRFRREGLGTPVSL
eukprot:scaffold167_cov244-Pinguiococcus_pyrenoidosus.AAC.9